MRASRERPAFPQHDPAAFRFSFERVQAEAAKKREAAEAERAAAAQQHNTDAWAKWVNERILSMLKEYNKGVAEVIVKWRGEDRAAALAAIDAAKAEIVEQTRAEMRAMVDEAMAGFMAQVKGEIATAVEQVKTLNDLSSPLGLPPSVGAAGHDARVGARYARI
jgi:DNA-binding protein